MMAGKGYLPIFKNVFTKRGKPKQKIKVQSASPEEDRHFAEFLPASEPLLDSHCRRSAVKL